MDIQRLVLLSALGLSAYFLILAWNEDYNKPAYLNGPQIVHQNVSSAPAIPTSEFSNLAVNQANSNTDIPAIVPGVEEAVISTMENTATSQYVEIHSDTLNFTIDLVGGDIINVSLPKYAVHVETPDVPLTLLENNNMRVYIAQSGLIGPNGPDAQAGGRPLYNAPFSDYSLEEGDDQLKVTLSHIDAAGVEITKEFIFTRNSYLVDVKYTINNRSNTAW